MSSGKLGGGDPDGFNPRSLLKTNGYIHDKMVTNLHFLNITNEIINWNSKWSVCSWIKDKRNSLVERHAFDDHYRADDSYSLVPANKIEGHLRNLFTRNVLRLEWSIWFIHTYIRVRIRGCVNCGSSRERFLKVCLHVPSLYPYPTKF